MENPDLAALIAGVVVFVMLVFLYAKLARKILSIRSHNDRGGDGG